MTRSTRWVAAITTTVAALITACAAPSTDLSEGEAGSPTISQPEVIGGTPTTAPPVTTRPTSTTTPGTLPSTFISENPRMGVGGCPIFPRDNVFGATVTGLPVRADSDRVIASMGGTDLGVRPAYTSKTWQGSRAGLPINIVDSRTTPMKDVTGGKYGYMSDLEDHPIPSRPRIEGEPNLAWDRHMLIVDSATCVTSEFFYVTPPWLNPFGGWVAATAVKLDLNSNTPRKRGTATASGTSMFAGLTLYDEVAAGEIDHVIGITIPKIKAGETIWPATRTDGASSDPDAPAMGTWLRLRADIDLSALGPQARVVAQALKDHGAIVIDTNGSDIALGGEAHDGWDDRDMRTLSTLNAADFEVIDASPMMISKDSYQIR